MNKQLTNPMVIMMHEIQMKTDDLFWISELILEQLIQIDTLHTTFIISFYHMNIFIAFESGKEIWIFIQSVCSCTLLIE